MAFTGVINDHGPLPQLTTSRSKLNNFFGSSCRLHILKKIYARAYLLLLKGSMSRKHKNEIYKTFYFVFRSIRCTRSLQHRRVLLKLDKQIGGTIYRPILAANEAYHLEGVEYSIHATLDADFHHQMATWLYVQF